MATHLSDLDDASLLLRLEEHDHDAFTELVHRHATRYYRIAYRLVFNKTDAEDIVQEAFLKLWARPKLWDPARQVKFTTWFYKVVINLCLDLKKKKKPAPLPEDLPLADGTPGQYELLDHLQTQAFVEHLMQCLPQRQQLALNLCFYEGLTNKEAAHIMGVTVKVLQSLIMRGKTTLREKVRLPCQGSDLAGSQTIKRPLCGDGI